MGVLAPHRLPLREVCRAGASRHALARCRVGGQGIAGTEEVGGPAPGPLVSIAEPYVAVGRFPLPASAPAGLASPFRLASGLAGQLASHAGQPVSDDWLIIALAPICEPNGASPASW